MDSIEADDLYEERGSVSFCRPVLQGDIFGDVVLPGFGDEPRLVQIVTHPCSMRRGTVINERVQVAPVTPYQKVPDWGQHGRVMPLPDLRGDDRWYAAKFVDLTSVGAIELTLDRRIASLSHPGIHILQQRLVFHHTRLRLRLADFRQMAAPVLAESELQEAWVESVLPPAHRTVANIEEAATTFQLWLDQDDKHRRTELNDEANHARLRREARIASAAQRL